MEPALAREAHDWILQDKRSQAGFAYYARRALRAVEAGAEHPLATAATA